MKIKNTEWSNALHNAVTTTNKLYWRMRLNPIGNKLGMSKTIVTNTHREMTEHGWPIRMSSFSQDTIITRRLGDADIL